MTIVNSFDRARVLERLSPYDESYGLDDYLAVLGGPREWSPRMKVAKEDLKIFETMFSEDLKVSLEEIQNGEVSASIDLVKAGVAFVIKEPKNYFTISICSKGRIRVDEGLLKRIQEGTFAL